MVYSTTLRIHIHQTVEDGRLRDDHENTIAVVDWLHIDAESIWVLCFDNSNEAIYVQRQCCDSRWVRTSSKRCKFGRAFAKPSRTVSSWAVGLDRHTFTLQLTNWLTRTGNMTDLTAALTDCALLSAVVIMKLTADWQQTADVLITTVQLCSCAAQLAH